MIVAGPTETLVIFLLLAVLLILALTWTARPWRSQRVKLVDRLKIGAAIVRYDFWLELRGVGRHRRRDLREELRANLNDAAERVGTAQALTALGSLRRMSVEATAGAATGPRWSTGISVATGAFLVVAFAELFALISWISGAEASGVARVQGSLPLFPGSQVTWDSTGDGFSVDFALGWLVFAAIAIAFILGSRPWLALSRRRHVDQAVRES